MKYFFESLCLCLSVLFIQGTFGGVIQDVEFNLERAKNEIETELADMVQPVIEGAQKLQERLVAYEIKQAEVAAFSFGNMNLSVCFDLGETIEGSSKLAWNISETAYQTVMNISNSFNKLTSNCASWNPVSAVECYVSNIKIIKKEIQSVKPLIKFYEKTVMTLLMHIEDQFLLCIGDEPSTKTPKPAPTNAPTAAPTPAPTQAPTQAPSKAPTASSAAPPSPKQSNEVKTAKKPWYKFW